MYGDISLQSAKSALAANPNIKLIDVRRPEEYRKGHIANSINVPLDSIRSIKNIVANKNDTIFVYCQSGSRGLQAKDDLVRMGYTNVTFIGGVQGWRLVH